MCGRSVAVGAALLVAGVAAQLGGPLVTTRQGALLGRDEFVAGRRVFSWRGIKYAEVAARFQYASLYTDAWSGTKPALEHGLPCPQPFLATGEYSEDCLHVSVWSPALPGPGPAPRLLPVVVLLTGTLWSLDPGPANLAPHNLVSERNLVVVTVSSRLNVFGFLSLENVVVPGNMGLLDQYFSLIWVQNNIRYFGGDPGRVTLAGTGSGAAAALYLALSPRSSGLLQRVVAVGGTPLAAWASSSRALENARRIVDRVNCYGPNSRAVLRCLQAKNAREIVSAVESHLASGNISNIFAPVADSFLNTNDQFIGDSLERLRRGDVDRRITYMIGENSADGSEMMNYLRRNFDRLETRDVMYFVENTLVPVSLLRYGSLVASPFIQQLISFQYFPAPAPGLPEVRQPLLESVQTFLTDSYYAAPLRETLDLLARAGAAVYNFANTHAVRPQLQAVVTRPQPGAAAVTALLLGARQFELETGTALGSRDREAAVKVQDALVPFIERGEPQADLRWPRYTLQNKHYLEVNSLRIYTEYKVTIIIYCIVCF